MNFTVGFRQDRQPDKHIAKYLEQPRIAKMLIHQKQLQKAEQQPLPWREMLAHLGNVPNPSRSRRKIIVGNNVTPKGLQLRDHSLSEISAKDDALNQCRCFSTTICPYCAVLERRRRLFDPNNPIDCALSKLDHDDLSVFLPSRSYLRPPSREGSSGSRPLSAASVRPQADGTHNKYDTQLRPRRPTSATRSRPSSRDSHFSRRTTGPSRYNPAPPRPPTPMLNPSSNNGDTVVEFENERGNPKATTIKFSGVVRAKSSTAVCFNLSTDQSVVTCRRVHSKASFKDSLDGETFVPRYTGRMFRAASKLQAWWRGSAERQVLRQRQFSAVFIQRMYRAVMRRRDYLEAACLLQQVGRGLILRAKFSLFAGRKLFHRCEYLQRTLICEEHDQQLQKMVDCLAGQLYLRKCEEERRFDCLCQEMFNRSEFMSSFLEQACEPYFRGKIEDQLAGLLLQLQSNLSSALEVCHRKLRLEKEAETCIARTEVSWDVGFRELVDTFHFRRCENAFEPYSRRALATEELEARIQFFKAVPDLHTVFVLSERASDREQFMRNSILQEEALWYHCFLRLEFSRHSLMLRYLEGAQRVCSYEAVERKNLMKRTEGGFVI